MIPFKYKDSTYRVDFYGFVEVLKVSKRGAESWIPVKGNLARRMRNHSKKLRAKYGDTG